MVKKTGAALMMERIRTAQMQFLSMSSEDRIKFISGYEFLQPYQVTALYQCKRYMSPQEKRALKQAIEKIKAKNSDDQTPPQPM